MNLNVKEFLDTVQNPLTRKGYRHGIKKFCEYYQKTAEEILNQRKDDLTPKNGRKSHRIQEQIGKILKRNRKIPQSSVRKQVLHK